MSGYVHQSLEQIGAALHDARVTALMTQSEVGERAGVSRQLVSRIEQGCNGEISAYVAVAGALGYRFIVVQERAVDDSGGAGLDFGPNSAED